MVIILGVPIFRIFTVVKIHVLFHTTQDKPVVVQLDACIYLCFSSVLLQSETTFMTSCLLP